MNLAQKRCVWDPKREALRWLSLLLDLKPREGPWLDALVTMLSPEPCKFVVLSQ